MKLLISWQYKNKSGYTSIPCNVSSLHEIKEETLNYVLEIIKTNNGFSKRPKIIMMVLK